MNSSPSIAAMRERIALALSQHPGWSAIGSGTAVASKGFETAADPIKVAHAYVEKWPKGYFVLTGDYRSEGRNVLEPVRHSLAWGMTDEAVRHQVAAFVAEAEVKINQTYARGLFLRAASA